MKLIKELVQISEDAEYAKQLVRGEKSAPGLLNKLDLWINNILFTKEKNSFIHAKTADKQLKDAGFSELQISMIHDAAADAAVKAADSMNDKYEEEVVPRKHAAAISSSFKEFRNFNYFGIGDAMRKEFTSTMRKLFDAKINEIKDKLVIKKNQ